MLICELLVNGITPSFIPANIQTMPAALTGSEVNELPSLYYVRKCRVVVQNLNNMLAACNLRKEESWQQIFADGTTGRQVKFQNLMNGLMADGDFESVIV